MKYLDYNGVSRLWSKIKSTFAQKKTQTVTLTSSGWTLSGGAYVQTISVSGVTANSILIVASAPSNSKVYGECGVKCVSQTAGKLTFNADNKPSVNLTANILNLGDST